MVFLFQNFTNNEIYHPVINRQVVCPQIESLYNTSSCTTLKDPLCKKLNSLASYVMSDKPHAVPTLKTEGLLQGQGLYDISKEARKDFNKILQLAYGWKVTHNEAYKMQLRLFLRSWQKTYNPSFNPVDERGFADLFEGYALVREDLNAADVRAIDLWALKFYRGYLNQIKNEKKLRGPNTNWQSHRIKIMTSVAVALNDVSLLRTIESIFKTQLLATIYQDGAIRDYYTRDSLEYVTYSLESLVESALLSQSAGESWLSGIGPEGQNYRDRLVKALDWLAVYAKGQKKHREFVNSKFKFDRVRSEAGVSGHVMGTVWDRHRAKRLFWYASYLFPDQGYTQLAEELGEATSFMRACHN